MTEPPVDPFEPFSPAGGLSPEGGRRRDAMLGHLLIELHASRASRRQRARLGSGVLAAALTALAFIPAVREWGKVSAPLAGEAPDRGWSAVVRLTTEPGVAERAEARLAALLAAAPRVDRRSTVSHPARVGPGATPTRAGFRIARLDDERFERLLSEIGRPAGIVRMNGEAWLTAAVTDAELASVPREQG